MTTESYLSGILADATRPFRYRSGVARLLGQPDAVGPQLIPARSLAGVFPYLARSGNTRQSYRTATQFDDWVPPIACIDDWSPAPESAAAAPLPTHLHPPGRDASPSVTPWVPAAHTGDHRMPNPSRPAGVAAQAPGQEWPDVDPGALEDDAMTSLRIPDEPASVDGSVRRATRSGTEDVQQDPRHDHTSAAATDVAAPPDPGGPTPTHHHAASAASGATADRSAPPRPAATRAADDVRAEHTGARRPQRGRPAVPLSAAPTRTPRPDADPLIAAAAAHIGHPPGPGAPAPTHQRASNGTAPDRSAPLRPATTPAADDVRAERTGESRPPRGRPPVPRRTLRAAAAPRPPAAALAPRDESAPPDSPPAHPAAPDVVHVLPAVADPFAGTMAFWTRRRIRRWQMGLLR